MVLRVILYFGLCIPLFLLAACGTTSSTLSYPAAHASVPHKLVNGRILEARDVTIDGHATNMGMIVGGGIGSAVGAIAVPVKSTTTITPNSSGGVDVRGSSNAHESRAAIAAGAALGAIAGRKIEKKLSTRKAQELVIELEGGETMVIVQPIREPAFRKDEKVRVYSTKYGASKVFHSDEDPFIDPETNAYLIPEVGDEEIVTW